MGLDSSTVGLWTKLFGAGYNIGYAPVSPLGFYTSFDDYLVKDTFKGFVSWGGFDRAAFKSISN